MPAQQRPLGALRTQTQRASSALSLAGSPPSTPTQLSSSCSSSGDVFGPEALKSSEPRAARLPQTLTNKLCTTVAFTLLLLVVLYWLGASSSAAQKDGGELDDTYLLSSNASATLTPACQRVTKAQACAHRASIEELSANGTLLKTPFLSHFSLLGLHGILCFDIDAFRTVEGELHVGYPPDVVAALSAFAKRLSASGGHLPADLASLSDIAHVSVAHLRAARLLTRFPPLPDALAVFGAAVAVHRRRLPPRAVPRLFVELKGSAFSLEGLAQLRRMAADASVSEHVGVWFGPRLGEGGEKLVKQVTHAASASDLEAVAAGLSTPLASSSSALSASALGLSSGSGMGGEQPASWLPFGSLWGWLTRGLQQHDDGGSVGDASGGRDGGSGNGGPSRQLWQLWQQRQRWQQRQQQQGVRRRWRLLQQMQQQAGGDASGATTGANSGVSGGTSDSGRGIVAGGAAVGASTVQVITAGLSNMHHHHHHHKHTQNSGNAHLHTNINDALGTQHNPQGGNDNSQQQQQHDHHHTHGSARQQQHKQGHHHHHHHHHNSNNDGATEWVPRLMAVRALPDSVPVGANGTREAVTLSLTPFDLWGFDVFGPSIKQSDKLLGELQQAGRPVAAWVIDTDVDVDRALQYGFHFLISNYPLRVHGMLTAKRQQECAQQQQQQQGRLDASDPLN